MVLLMTSPFAILVDTGEKAHQQLERDHSEMKEFVDDNYSDLDPCT